MGMVNSAGLNKELTDTLGYLIDKFNLTLEVSGEQIKEFSTQLANKIIRWEILGSSFMLILHLILALLLFKVVTKKFKNITIKNIIELEKIKDDKEIIKIFMKIVCYIVLFALALIIMMELGDIILCIAFPEKIILEFISNYI